MKLFRFGALGQEKPGIIAEDGAYLDASAFGQDLNEDFFASDGIKKLARWWHDNKSTLKPIPEGSRIGSCVARPSKIICIGLNYRDHALESNMAIPTEPIVFFKSTTSLTGPNDNLIIPKNSHKTDWEVELAIIIGKKAQYITEDQALSHIAGFALHNDYSEREWQLERGGQWVKGKSADTYAPLGPWLVTTEEVPHYQSLNLWLNVNGESKQYGNTENMIFNVPFLVSYVSQFMTLLPGDVISTGTPAGVGLALNPQQWVQPGDVITLGIDGLGTSTQHAHAYSAQ